jgi:beta-glucanase (GH16 family)
VKTSLLLMAIALMLTCDSPLFAQSASATRTLVWSDEFSGTEVDKAKWAFSVGGGGFGNNEMQWYSNKPDNSSVANGELHIVALKQKTAGWPYTSAKLTSRQSWLYGRIEVRAKVPTGVGSWPAIWMLPDAAFIDIAAGPVASSWPATGEIDIMEHVGFEPTLIAQTFHTGAFNFKIGTQKGTRQNRADAETAFHVYGLDWSPEKADLLLDGEVVYTFPNMHKTVQEWPFDKPFSLILNMAVGGDWGGQQGIDNASLPWTFSIDWVRVYSADH